MKHSLYSPTTAPSRKRSRASAPSPTEYLVDAFRENGHSQQEVIDYAGSQMIPVTPEMIEGYTIDVTKAVRDGDLKKLQELYEDKGSAEGLCCCNRFGDSLVHIACRHGHTSIVKFLVEEAQVPVNRVDDIQRTPLHDACWRPEPNYEIVDTLLRVAPHQVFCVDKCGSKPFQYARTQHRQGWIDFLSTRRSMMVLPKNEQTEI